jgi:serine phosphatase RsbU (regulator of sigma subunit)
MCTVTANGAHDEGPPAEECFDHTSTLVLYSDVLTEAKGAGGEMFGDAGLHAALARTDKPVASVRAALARHIGHRSPEDDSWLIALRV